MLEKDTELFIVKGEGELNRESWIGRHCVHGRRSRATTEQVLDADFPQRAFIVTI